MLHQLSSWAAPVNPWAGPPFFSDITVSPCHRSGAVKKPDALCSVCVGNFLTISSLPHMEESWIILEMNEGFTVQKQYYLDTRIEGFRGLEWFTDLLLPIVEVKMIMRFHEISWNGGTPRSSKIGEFHDWNPWFWGSKLSEDYSTSISSSVRGSTSAHPRLTGLGRRVLIATEWTGHVSSVKQTPVGWWLVRGWLASMLRKSEQSNMGILF